MWASRAGLSQILDVHGFENTLYIGGGTPSLLSAVQMAALADAVRVRYGITVFDEFTVEANPDDVAFHSEYLSGLRKAGVNRLSMGVQSFDDSHLRFMNRRHSAAEAVEAFRTAREAGFANISLDLIFGYGGLDLESWRHDIGQLVALKPEHVDSCFWGEFVRAEYDKFGGSVERMGDDIWNNSAFTSWDRLEKAINTPHAVAFFSSDPLVRFFRSPNMLKFNNALTEEDEGVDRFFCEKSYTRRLYRRQIADGEDIYPDANSTMRVSYGNVTDLRPRDGVICSWRSTSAGLLQKYDSTKYEYALKPDFIKLVRSNSWGPYKDKDGTMHLNFLTNNDITGGNSGSPVLDGYGRLIGLAFDGNKESQASNFYYKPGYDDCVCVDIRYVLWVLDRYVHFHRILNELTFE